MTMYAQTTKWCVNRSVKLYGLKSMWVEVYKVSLVTRACNQTNLLSIIIKMKKQSNKNQENQTKNMSHCNTPNLVHAEEPNQNITGPNWVG